MVLYDEGVVLVGKLFRLVPDREGEHSDESLEQLDAPMAVAVEDDLGVATAMEVVALVLELAPEREVIVDLTVEDERYAEAVGPRLPPRVGEVDDRQSSMREDDPALRKLRAKFSGNLKGGIG